MQAPRHILVIRFSSMGDVAIAVPVIKNVLQQNSHVHTTIVSNAFFEPLFQNIERCSFYATDLKGRHKGIAGIFRLHKELKSIYTFDAIADLHNVLRSSLLKIFFYFDKIAKATIDKGRKEKKELTRKKNKILRPLTPMHERYAEVFRKLGLNVTLDNEAPFAAKQPVADFENIFTRDKKVIGVSPFARHTEKMYPLEKMKTVVLQLAADNTILLFGAPHKEAVILQQWANEIKGVINIAGKFSFEEELSIISNLSIMVSMDSANMHLASLFGVPVISIWGATHPYAGFSGWAQQQKNIVQATLYCRPCSVFGNKPCYRGDHACMQMITTQMIVAKVISCAAVT